MAGVSRSALQKVKSAMMSSSLDSQRVLQDLCRQANDSVSQCAQDLSVVIRQRDDLQATVTGQKQQVKLLRQEIDSVCSDIRALEGVIKQLSAKAESLEQRISMINRDLDDLHIQLTKAETDEEKEQISKQINAKEQARQEALSERRENDRRLSESRRMLTEKQAQLPHLKNELSLLDSSLAENEHKLRILTDKCERLKSAFSARFKSITRGSKNFLIHIP